MSLNYNDLSPFDHLHKLTHIVLLAIQPVLNTFDCRLINVSRPEHDKQWKFITTEFCFSLLSHFANVYKAK